MPTASQPDPCYHLSLTYYLEDTGDTKRGLPVKLIRWRCRMCGEPFGVCGETEGGGRPGTEVQPMRGAVYDSASMSPSVTSARALSRQGSTQEVPVERAGGTGRGARSERAGRVTLSASPRVRQVADSRILPGAPPRRICGNCAKPRAEHQRVVSMRAGDDFLVCPTATFKEV